MRAHGDERQFAARIEGPRWPYLTVLRSMDERSASRDAMTVNRSNRFYRTEKQKNIRQ